MDPVLSGGLQTRGQSFHITLTGQEEILNPVAQ